MENSLVAQAPTTDPVGDSDPALDAALRDVFDIILHKHGLRSNQILMLSSELHRLGTHKLVEEHILKERRRQVTVPDDS